LKFKDDSTSVEVPRDAIDAEIKKAHQNLSAAEKPTSGGALVSARSPGRIRVSAA
jgi:hypothetical protein